jgi:lysophospholipase L1-like esterase
MAALGDSITQALMTCSNLNGCPANSWSTGTAVNSHLVRLKAAGAASIVGYNDSVSGAASAALNTQAQKAVSSAQNAQYVTIEIGANDACTKTVSAMTPTATFKANVQAALATLAAGPSAPQIFVASVPSLQRLYDLNKSSLSARFAWAIFGICQSMLANPTSTAQTDVDRRARVRQRVIDFNTQLAQACVAYGANCDFDDNAVFNYPFVLSQVSTWDYFHPNRSGQAVLASVSYAATFNW